MLFYKPLPLSDFKLHFWRVFASVIFFMLFIYIVFVACLQDVYADGDFSTTSQGNKKTETPARTLVRFADYILGHPRSAGDVVVLCGTALTLFCTVMAISTYLIDHGYFKLFITFFNVFLRIIKTWFLYGLVFVFEFDSGSE
jgi:hypothetical protein